MGGFGLALKLGTVLTRTRTIPHTITCAPLTPTLAQTLIICPLQWLCVVMVSVTVTDRGTVMVWVRVRVGVRVRPRSRVSVRVKGKGWIKSYG